MHSDRFEYCGYWLSCRSDSRFYYICWYDQCAHRTFRQSTRSTNLDSAKRLLMLHAERARQLPAGNDDFSLFGHAAIIPDLVPVTRWATSFSLNDPTGYSVAEALQAYVQRLQAENKASYPQALIALKHWSTFCASQGLLFIQDLTLEKQEHYVAMRRLQRTARGSLVTDSTISRELSVLRSTFQYAWKRGRAMHAPHVMGLPQGRPRQRFLSVTEVRNLLEACTEPHLRRFVILALHTLQRPSAIFDLKLEQVDLVHGRIDFLPLGNTQSNKRRPVVPINDTLRRELEQAFSDSESGYVVEYKGKPIRTKLRRSFAKACVKAGLRDTTPYTLRHTGATLLAAAGVPMRQISGMLGHSSEQMTERYAKHRPEFLRNAIQRLEDLFGSSMGYLTA